MTKFILHGGATGIENKHNEAFYQKWVADFDSKKIPVILLTYFSRSKENWEYLEKSDKERFAKYTNNRQVKFIIASEDINKFKEQINLSDVIYFRGGKPEKIVRIIREIKDDFLSLINNKLFVGSSAGVMFLSNYAKSHETDWEKYLGLLPINTIVHYSKEDYQQSLQDFKDKHPDNKDEYILIPETEFVVREF